MKVYSASQIRNVVVMGHSGCGKTTLTEAALNLSGATKRVGKVEDGNTVSDYEAEEIRRRVSISTSIVPVEWEGTKINFLDTPGYFDFAGEVKEALRAADLALIMVSARSGIEVGTEKAWEYATEAGLPKMIFINNMDDDNANFDKVVEDMKERFGLSIAPIQVPFKENGIFNGYVDAITKEGRCYVDGKPEPCDIPDGMEDEVDIMHEMIREAVAETDDELLMRYFEDEPFTEDEIETGIKNGLIDGSVTPVFCGVSTELTGVRVLLDSIVQFAHSPDEFRATKPAIDPGTKEEIEISTSEDEPFSAFVFKTIADPYVGQLSIIRVFSGVLNKDDTIYNVKKGERERAGQIFVMKGKEQIIVPQLKAGDIGAIARLSVTETDDTLCDEDRQILFADTVYPEPLYKMALETTKKGDEDRLASSFARLIEEDMTLRFGVDPETKQTVITGVGDTQLDVVRNKLKNSYNVEIAYSDPVIPYREMIKNKVRVQARYRRQSGGHGQYGDVHMEFEPSGDLTKPYIFEEEIFGGAVPRQYFPAVEKGIEESCEKGPLAGYPVVGIKATLVDGSYHSVDSSELAFKMAANLAFKDGFMKAKPAILEPIAKISIKVPNDYTGDIMGDITKKRGRILGMDKEGDKQVINAEAPMSELFKYSTELRSMTQGRGDFTMAFERYEEAPQEVQDKIISQRKEDDED